MRGNVKLESKYLICAAILFAISSKGIATNSDKSLAAQAMRNAQSNGSGIALAVYCKFPKDRIQMYADALKANSIAYAKVNNLNFSEEEYRDDAQSGFNSTMDFMRTLSPTKENIKKNCAEVDEEMSQTLKRHD